MKKLLISAITAVAMLAPLPAFASDRSEVIATFMVLGCYVEEGEMTTDQAGEFAIEYFMDNDISLNYAMSIMNEPGFAQEVVGYIEDSGGCRGVLK